MNTKTKQQPGKTDDEQAGVKKGTEVATQQKPSLPANLNTSEASAGVGIENADKDSFALPFLVILQKMSPQLDRNDPEYLPEAREGDILNTATRKIHNGDEGIFVAPVAFKRSYTQWKLREKGGGYMGEFTVNDAQEKLASCVQDEKKRNIMPDKVSQLVDTRLHGVILIGGVAPAPALLNMTSTQIKKSKRWVTDMDELQKGERTPDRPRGYSTWVHVYKLTTIPESNDQGSWYGWKIEHEGFVTEQEVLDAGAAFYRALAAGAAQMSAEKSAEQPS